VSRVSFGSKGGKVKSVKVKDKPTPSKTAEEVVRKIKEEQSLQNEGHRERSLALHGLVCAHCGREFTGSQRQLLTVHHKDGNHFNNPPDGSNWENLCVYCHEDTHSRGLLGDYLEGGSSGRESSLVYGEGEFGKSSSSGTGSLGEKFKIAMEKKRSK